MRHVGPGGVGEPTQRVVGQLFRLPLLRCLPQGQGHSPDRIICDLSVSTARLGKMTAAILVKEFLGCLQGKVTSLTALYIHMEHGTVCLGP